MTRRTKWTRVVWHALWHFEVLRLRARRNGFRLSISVHKNGDVVAKIEECRPPIHAVVERATKQFGFPGVATNEAVQQLRADQAATWCEEKADELAAELSPNAQQECVS
jgi:hypothetical protein